MVFLGDQVRPKGNSSGNTLFQGVAGTLPGDGHTLCFILVHTHSAEASALSCRHHRRNDVGENNPVFERWILAGDILRDISDLQCMCLMVHCMFMLRNGSCQVARSRLAQYRRSTTSPSGSRRLASPIHHCNHEVVFLEVTRSPALALASRFRNTSANSASSCFQKTWQF